MSTRSPPLNSTELDILLAVFLGLDIYRVGLLPRELASLGNYIICNYDYEVIYTNHDWLFFCITEQEKSHLCQFLFNFSVRTLDGQQRKHVSHQLVTTLSMIRNC